MLSSNFRNMSFKEHNKIITLFLLALLVRVIGINYGYWLGDENINSAAKVLSGNVVPDQHFYPPLLNYITAIFFGILYVVGRLFVSWYDVAEFRAHYFSDPTPFYITARLVVALISSALAPLFYLIAREYGLKSKHAFIVGLLGVLIPGMVFLSHIAKSDVPLSVCVVLVFYLSLKKIKAPSSIFIDVFLGIAVALALSFKQSYIFILIPYFSIFLFLFYKEGHKFRLFLKSLLIIFFTSLISWAVFNIGIILDFNDFLDYQKIQTVMSVRDDKDFLAGVSVWWSIVADSYLGISTLGVILFLASPTIILFKESSGASARDYLFLALWVSLMLGSLVVMYLSGERQQSGLWVPYMTGMQLIAALFLMLLLPRLQGVYLISLKALTCLFLLVSLYGVVVVDKQAIARPIVLSVEDYLRENYQEQDQKILSSFLLQSPQTVDMEKAEFTRHEKVAKKYSVTLPERAEENTSSVESLNPINYFNMPVAFHGLENADDADLEGVMRAYAWPLQKEEWSLDYWLRKNFEIFVLADHEYSLYKSKVKLIKLFHQEIKNRCLLVKHFDPIKPLYIEFSATIYNCVD